MAVVDPDASSAGSRAVLLTWEGLEAVSSASFLVGVGVVSYLQSHINIIKVFFLQILFYNFCNPKNLG